MGIFDLFFDKYTKIHGTKCILKKKEVLKLCNNGVRLDLDRTRYTIEKSILMMILSIDLEKDMLEIILGNFIVLFLHIFLIWRQSEMKEYRDLHNINIWI